MKIKIGRQIASYRVTVRVFSQFMNTLFFAFVITVNTQHYKETQLWKPDVVVCHSCTTSMGICTKSQDIWRNPKVIIFITDDVMACLKDCCSKYILFQWFVPWFINDHIINRMASINIGVVWAPLRRMLPALPGQGRRTRHTEQDILLISSASTLSWQKLSDKMF